MPAIGAFLLGLLFTFGGYRVLRLAARLFSAALFAGVAGYLALDAVSFWLSALLGYLLGDALYYLFIFAGGAAGGALLGFWTAGEVGLAAGVAGAFAGAAAALLFERPLAIVAMATLGGYLLSFAA